MQSGDSGQSNSVSKAEAEPPIRLQPRRRRYRGSGGAIKLNLAPMIDVTFLLLIFFLVTTTFERAEGILSSKLPRDRGATAVALPISPIVVRISPTGPGDDDYMIRVDNFPNVPADFLELADYLRQIQGKPGFDEETPVVVVAAHEVLWDHVVGAWNAAVVAGCKNIVFAEE